MLDWIMRRWFAKGPTISQPMRTPVKLRVEALESRELLSASALPTAQAALQLGALVTSPSPYGHTPAQIRQAYGFSQIRFGNIVGDGRGQTIAIIDAYDDPYIATDLHTFDREFGLADPPSFTKVNEYGRTTSLPAASATWALEISLDVEWAHAMAPGANIMLVEASTSGLGDLLTAVGYATSVPSVSVVSMSWGAPEFWSETYYDSYFTTPAGHQGITFVAASGDSGAPANWPAVSPNVVGVGGTNLYLGAGGTYGSESGWSLSGGGLSPYEPQALGQHATVPWEVKRTAPDVAYDANPNTGFAIYDTMGYGSWTGWLELGGTSAGAPQWAALMAIANQGRALVGLGTLDGASQTLPAIYAMPNSAFHQIVSGGNIYGERVGYGCSTGRGTPYANSLVQDLVAVGAGGEFASLSGTSLVKAGGAGAPAIAAPVLPNGSETLGQGEGRSLLSPVDSFTLPTHSDSGVQTAVGHLVPMRGSVTTAHADLAPGTVHARLTGATFIEGSSADSAQAMPPTSSAPIGRAYAPDYRRAPVLFDLTANWGSDPGSAVVALRPVPMDINSQPTLGSDGFGSMAATSLVALGLRMQWEIPDEDRRSRG